MDSLADILNEDLKKFKNNVEKNFAKIVADELTEACRNAITDFYDQYDPENPALHHGRVYYYRHWNFNNSNRVKTFRKYTKRNVGGVELLPSNLPNVYRGKNSSPQSVFDRVYLGLHGIASLQGYGVPRLQPSPIRRLLDKQKYIIDHADEYCDRAVDMALREQYYFL